MFAALSGYDALRVAHRRQEPHNPPGKEQVSFAAAGYMLHVRIRSPVHDATCIRPLPTTLLLGCRGLFGTGYTQTLYAEDGRRVTLSPEEVRHLNVAVRSAHLFMQVCSKASSLQASSARLIRF